MQRNGNKALLATGEMLLGAGLAAAQVYPNKPVRLVTAEPGGGNDFAATIKSEIVRMGKVIKDAGIREE